MGERRAVLIAGPTASGKSALALDMARRLGGVVINADAMQVYSTLRVLTARPGPKDMDGVPHRLYGMVDPGVRFSTGDWLRSVAALIAENDERALVFVGGTGLYFEALTNGFAEIPPVPDDVLAAVEGEIAGLDAEGRMRLLRAEDAATAERIGVADPQRVARAIAVRRATGRALSAFQSEPQSGVLEGFAVERLVVDPGREASRERIAARFETMLETGAVDEVRALLAMKLDPALPAMKAIGVREIGAWLDGAIERPTMAERVVTATRQYAKRQRTWLRNRMGDWPRSAPSW